jgi:hypothetical protein
VVLLQGMDLNLIDRILIFSSISNLDVKNRFKICKHENDGKRIMTELKILITQLSYKTPNYETKVSLDFFTIIFFEQI